MKRRTKEVALTILMSHCISRARSFLPVQKNTHYMMIFDALVILICLASLILCLRSVVRGLQLQQVRLAAF